MSREQAAKLEGKGPVLGLLFLCTLKYPLYSPHPNLQVQSRPLKKGAYSEMDLLRKEHASE